MSIVIYPPTLDWSWMKQRPQHLMRQLAAAGHTVFYCSRTQSAEPAPLEIEPRLHLVRNHEQWLKSGLAPIRRRNRVPVIVWCSLPMQLASIRKDYAPDFLVYDCADDCPEWYSFEKETAAAANLIVCSSERLLRRLTRCYPGKRIALVRNGYDPDMGLHLPQEDNRTGGRSDGAETELKQIGYIGAWAPWIDSALIRQLCSLRVTINVIGPEFGRKYWPADTAGHVRFLGLKRHDELASHIRDFSVCIIPFRQTPIALAANPIKAYEYLAAGKPVVSTDLPESRLMAPHVDVASARRYFVDAVHDRLEHAGEAEPRRQFAMANTWERRAAEISVHIRSMEQA